MDKKAISLVVVAIILLCVAVSVALLTIAWMGALTVTFPVDDDSKISAEIYAKIHSASHNLGVLNEEAQFDIFIENYANVSRTINIVVDANNHVLSNETVVIEALSSRSLTIKYKLISLGSWTIKIYADEAIVDGQQFYTGLRIVEGYSFITVANRAEADMRMNQWDAIRFNTNLSIAAIILSVLGVIVSIVDIVYVRRQSTRDNEKDKEEAKAEGGRIKNQEDTDKDKKLSE